jgi:hypothetical protein
MSYLGQSPFQEFTNPPTKDSFTGDGSTVAFDMSATVASNAQNALEVYVNNVRQEPGTGKAFTLGVDGSNDNKRITFTAAPANGAAIYVINDKTNTSVTAPLSNDLNGTELILDGDGDTSITADTDDRIDFKLAGVEHISIGNSSGDTIIKTRVDAKDIMFQQFDGRDVLEINDAGFVALHNGDSGSGQLRIYEDDDNGANFTAFQVGTQSADITYTLPTADGSSGQAITTNGSGVLSFATVSANTPSSADGQALGSASLEWSDLFLADASTIQFGADQDVTLTHVADTGLTLNSTMKLMFNDASQFIHAPSATVLDIAATDEIELTATLIDVVGNFTNSGTIVSAGVITAPSLVLGSTAVTTTPAELNLIDGGATVGTTAVADGDGILHNDGGAMKVTSATTFKTYFQEGISQAYDDFTVGDAAVTVSTSSGNVTVDSIAGAVSIDGHTGVTLASSNSGDITLDSVADIILDAGGDTIFLKDSGTTFGSLDNTSGNLIIKSGTTTAATFAGANVTLAGTVGSGAITSTGAIQGTTITATTSFLPDAQDGAALGTTSLQFSDLFLADAAVIGFGDDNEVTLTHVADTGLLLNAAMKIQFRDSAIHISSTADGDLAIAADDEIDITSTLIDINGNVEISGTATTTGVHTFTAVPVFPNNTVETADIQADAITAAKIADNAVVTAGINADAVTGAKIADDAIDSEHYTDGSIDAAHLASDSVTEAKMAANSVDSQAYVDGSIDTAHIADNQITLAKMAGGTDGNIISFDASGDPVAIATGSDGQVLTSTGAGSPPAFEAAAAGGKLLQIQHVLITGTVTSITSGDFTATEVLDIITPTAADSKILVMMNLSPGTYEDNGLTNQFGAGIYRDINGGGFSRIYAAQGNVYGGYGIAASLEGEYTSNFPTTLIFVDSTHNSTNAITYKLYISQRGGNSTNTGSSAMERSVTLMEIGA